jgi:hypothetical protein
MKKEWNDLLHNMLYKAKQAPRKKDEKELIIQHKDLIQA